MADLLVPKPDQGAQPTQPSDIEGVDTRVLSVLLQTLKANLKAVFEANRFFEEQTGLANEAGASNLTEALSHIGTLAEESRSLSYEEQSAQVALLDDHLRRSMMEAFEQLVKARLGKLAPLMSEYRRKALPLVERGKLRGVKSHDEVQVLQKSIASSVEAGRASKAGTSWKQWKEGADHLGKAAEDSAALLEALEQAIGSAQQYRRWRLGIVLAVVAVLVALAVGLPPLLE